MSKTRLIFKKIKSKDESRFITVFGDFPFYQSTGHNSSHAGTWFPFVCADTFPLQLRKPGFVIDPLTNDSLKENFPEDIWLLLQRHLNFKKINFDKANKDEELVLRFGNFELMCLSMIIGTGFWKTNTGKKLQKEIETLYFKKIEQLRQTFQPYLASFENPKINETFQLKRDNKRGNLEINKNNNEKINTWLKKSGSVLSVEHPGIALKYNNFRSIARENEKKKNNKEIQPNKDKSTSSSPSKFSTLTNKISTLPGWQRFLVGAGIGLGAFILAAGLVTLVGAAIYLAAPVTIIAASAAALTAAPLFTGLIAGAGALLTALIGGVAAAADQPKRKRLAPAVTNKDLTSESPVSSDNERRDLSSDSFSYSTSTSSSSNSMGSNSMNSSSSSMSPSPSPSPPRKLSDEKTPHFPTLISSETSSGKTISTSSLSLHHHPTIPENQEEEKQQDNLDPHKSEL